MWKNIWPKEVTSLKTYYEKTGNYVKSVGLELAKVLDAYLLKEIATFKPQIYERLNESPKLAARAIYYRPPGERKELPKNWCSWHKDYSYITGLVPGTFLDKNGNIINNYYESDAGLYIQKRDYEIIQLTIPEDCIAF